VRKWFIAFLVANAIPLIGVLYFDWNFLELVVLYWAETIIVGFYSVLRILKVEKLGDQRMSSAVFFAVHFSAFILMSIIGMKIIFIDLLGHFPGNYDSLWPLLNPMPLLRQFSLDSLLISSIMFFISHGVIYKEKYLETNAYKTAEIRGLMSDPYMRLLPIDGVMVLAGSFYIMIGNQAPWIIFAFIGLKIYADFFAGKGGDKIEMT